MLPSVSFAVFVSALAQDRVATDVRAVAPTHVLSLLDPDRGDVDPLALGVAAARHLVMRFHDHLIANKPGGFTDAHLRTLLAFVDDAIASSKTAPVRLLVHCHHGQSRSP